jgi:hypothetical protein
MFSFKIIPVSTEANKEDPSEKKSEPVLNVFQSPAKSAKKNLLDQMVAGSHEKQPEQTA